MKGLIPILIVVFCMASQAQTARKYSQPVTISGNSIAHFQATFGPLEFPAVSHTFIWGLDSMTCADVLPQILYLVPANTAVAVLIDSTNDVRTGVPVSQHMECIETTISTLLARNPAMKIVVANTPPWTQYNPCTGTDNDPSIVQMIKSYNQAYADPSHGLQAQWPTNVRVADVFTPIAYPSGWAIPQDMTGPCGIHPGQEFQWSTSWATFAAPYEALVMQTLNGRW